MAGELRLQTQQAPSMFNKDMLLGGLLGSIVPVGLLGLTGGAALGVFAALTAGGALIGGLAGKNQIEKENREGKVVGKGSFWNKDTLIGGLIGLKGAGLVALATGVLTLGGTLATASVAPGAASTVLTGGLALTVLSLFATPLIGGYIGGKMGEKRMDREYEEAKKQNILQHVSRNVSPDIATAVEYTMDHKKDWGTKAMENKLLAAAMEQQR